MTLVTQDICVGDELAFYSLSHGLTFETVTSITSTGRIRCGRYRLNADLTIRGDCMGPPHRGERITPEIREEHNRQRFLRHLQNFDYTKLSTDQLRKLVLVSNSC